jgi:NADH:ubiquinone reductase (H+-translocating)
VGEKRVLIRGAGFGGLYTALGLEKTIARDGGVRVTIVNRENHSLFTPVLHDSKRAVDKPGLILGTPASS